MEEKLIRMINISKCVQKGFIETYWSLEKEIIETHENVIEKIKAENPKENADILSQKMEFQVLLSFISDIILKKDLKNEEYKFMGEELIRMGKEIVGE